MISIEFHYRLSRHKKVSGGILFVRVIARRRVASLTLPYRLLPCEWDQQRKQLLIESVEKKRREYLREIAFLLENDRRLLSELRSTITYVDENTARKLVDSFKARRFKNSFKQIAETLSEKLQDSGRERTARAYRSSLSAFLSYFGEKDISVTDINYSTLKGFEASLNEKGRSLNTISFYMRNLRAIYNKGVKQGWIVTNQKDLFQDVYTGVAASPKRALSTEQMKQLENLLIEPVRLKEQEKEALYLFLFSFHGRGISFVDLAYLKKENMKKNTLQYRRKKTGTVLEIELNPIMRKIIYFFEKKTATSPFIFPLITAERESYYKSYVGALRKQNQTLKDIARKAKGIEKLTTHMARHSWATIAKKKNIPVWVISEALGHQDIKTTYIYLDSFDKKVIHQAARKVSGTISQ